MGDGASGRKGCRSWEGLPGLPETQSLAPSDAPRIFQRKALPNWGVLKTFGRTERSEPSQEIPRVGPRPEARARLALRGPWGRLLQVHGPVPCGERRRSQPAGTGAPGSPARGETAHVGRAGCVSAGTRALSARPGSPLGHHAPTRWRLRSSGCLWAPEKATSGAWRQTGPEPQDSGHGRAARAAKVGFLSPWRPPRASVVGVGRAAAAGPCCGGQTQPEKSGWPHVWWRTGTRRPAVSKPGLGIERSTRSLADKHPLDSMPEAQNSVS